MHIITNPVIILVSFADQTVHALENQTFARSFVHARTTAEIVLKVVTVNQAARQRLLGVKEVFFWMNSKSLNSV